MYRKARQGFPYHVQQQEEADLWLLSALWLYIVTVICHQYLWANARDAIFMPVIISYERAIVPIIS